MIPTLLDLVEYKRNLTFLSYPATREGERERELGCCRRRRERERNQLPRRRRERERPTIIVSAEGETDHLRHCRCSISQKTDRFFYVSFALREG